MAVGTRKHDGYCATALLLRTFVQFNCFTILQNQSRVGLKRVSRWERWKAAVSALRQPTSQVSTCGVIGLERSLARVGLGSPAKRQAEPLSDGSRRHSTRIPT